MRVGFGTACITPALPCRLAGYARRTALSRTVAQQLWARSIVIDNGEQRLAWTICDLLAVDRALVADVRAAVADQVQRPPDAVMVSATHTHAGPDLLMTWAGDDGSYVALQEIYRQFLPRAIASSVVSAVADLSPAVLSWGTGSISGVAENRRADGGEHGGLGILVARDEARPGEAKAMVMVYACHGTVMGPGNLAVSGDVVGAGVEALERRTGLGGRCAWAQGAAGDVSTRANRRERTQQEADRLGLLVATAAEGIATSAEPVRGQRALGVEIVTVPLPLKAQAAVQRPSADLLERADDDRSPEALREEALAAIAQRAEGAQETVAEVSLLRIGELQLAFVPGEPFDSLERALIRAASPGRGELRMVGYSNGAPGYLFGPDDEAHGGYEVLSSPVAAAAGVSIVDVAVDLTRTGK